MNYKAHYASRRVPTGTFFGKVWPTEAAARKAAALELGLEPLTVLVGIVETDEPVSPYALVEVD